VVEAQSLRFVARTDERRKRATFPLGQAGGLGDSVQVVRLGSRREGNKDHFQHHINDDDRLFDESQYPCGSFRTSPSSAEDVLNSSLNPRERLCMDALAWIEASVPPSALHSLVRFRALLGLNRSSKDHELIQDIEPEGRA
jgi:hypothetical protein